MPISLRILSAVFILAAANSLPAQLNWAATERSLVADETRSEIETSFQFTNRGKHPVTITEVTTSCGCTVAAMRKTVYAPGEVGKIDVVIHYTLDVPQVETSVLVLTDEPEARPQTLVVKVAVPVQSRQERIEIRPRFVYWRIGAEPTPQVVTLRIVKLDDTIRPVSASTDDSSFGLQLRAPRIDDPFVYELVITPRNLELARQAEVEISTNWMPEEWPAGGQPFSYRLTVAIK